MCSSITKNEKTYLTKVQLCDMDTKELFYDNIENISKIKGVALSLFRFNKKMKNEGKKWKK